MCTIIYFGIGFVVSIISINFMYKYSILDIDECIDDGSFYCMFPVVVVFIMIWIAWPLQVFAIVTLCVFYLLAKFIIKPICSINFNLKDRKDETS